MVGDNEYAQIYSRPPNKFARICEDRSPPTMGTCNKRKSPAKENDLSFDFFLLRRNVECFLFFFRRSRFLVTTFHFFVPLSRNAYFNINTKQVYYVLLVFSFLIKLPGGDKYILL